MAAPTPHFSFWFTSTFDHERPCQVQIGFLGLLLSIPVKVFSQALAVSQQALLSFISFNTSPFNNVFQNILQNSARFTGCNLWKPPSHASEP